MKKLSRNFGEVIPLEVATTNFSISRSLLSRSYSSNTNSNSIKIIIVIVVLPIDTILRWEPH